MIYILCGGIVVLSGYIGKKIASRYREREEIYNYLLMLSRCIKDNLSYRKLKVDQVFDSFERANIKSKKLIDKLRNINNKKQETFSFLKADEVEIINSFFSELGEGNQDVENERINNFIKTIDTKHIECTNERKKNEGLIYKVSLAVGVVLAILII